MLDHGTTVPALPAPSRRVAGLAPVTHGGSSRVELQRRGLDPHTIIDLSTNVHPYGPPPAVRDIVPRVALTEYPDPLTRPMSEPIARHLGLDPDCIVAGNGSVELIFLLAQAYLDRGQRAVVIGPTFGEYAQAVRFVGGRIVSHRATEEDGFVLCLDTVDALVARVRPRLVFLCNPNNPTGRILSLEDLARLAHSVGSAGGLLVVDEAYRELADEGAYPAGSHELVQRLPIVFLRSLTKDFALPGLRVGYAVAPAAVGALLAGIRLPWSVNAIAEAVGAHLLMERDYLRAVRARLARDKAYLLQALETLDAPIVPTKTNYLLIRVGAASTAARACREMLLGHGVLVRDCTNFGLPTYIRVAVNRAEASDRLARGLAAWWRGALTPNPSPRARERGDTGPPMRERGDTAVVMQ